MKKSTELIQGRGMTLDLMLLVKDIDLAKKLALKQVDAIILEGNLLSQSLIDGYIDDEFNKYWNKVKQEINKI